MFDDHLDGGPPSPDRSDMPSQPISIPAPPAFSHGRRLSEESIRTELCDGPLPDSPVPTTPERESSAAVSDRAELIERLKRGESPTWIPNRHVRNCGPRPTGFPADCRDQLESLFHRNIPQARSGSPRPLATEAAALLPAADITPEKKNGRSEDVEQAERSQEGLSIERPRSALHSGDFTQSESPQDELRAREARDDAPLLSDRNAWIATSPPRHFTPFAFERRAPPPPRSGELQSGFSSLSSSFSSSFVYKPPTSPLVQSESHDDTDLSLPMDNIDITTSSPRNPRRHTLTSSSHHSSSYISAALHRQPPGLRRETAHPYQAHQPRRSLTSTPNFLLTGTSPQTPAFLRSRCPSFSSDTSPLQHASMVGSYEESILRGRMSTTPSKPLDFTAQIGVLGIGKCKSSLRCPAHVTLPFSAVFYSYSTTSHGRSKGGEDGPSPYVGLIDLENGLANPEEEQRARRKHQSRTLARRARDDDADMMDEPSDGDGRKAPARQKRRSASPRAPPGGAYRIPEKGQLQMVIKNQNKTAVKLFLVPYDLTGMEPGTKTFIRQRSYSAGPIIDSAPPAAATGDTAADRPILRYLIHLHICCPARGRFYLYKSIRVVFANRVPDGKEKLRNEISTPEPRFTAYKPIRVMHPPMTAAAQPTGPGAILAAEKAFRRRSSGYAFGHQMPPPFDLSPPSLPPPSRTSHHGPSLSFSGSNYYNNNSSSNRNIPVDTVPFAIARDRLASTVSNASDTTAQSLLSRPATQDSSSAPYDLTWPRPDPALARYDKIRLPPAHGSPSAAEGLLSQRLRSLGVQNPSDDAPANADATSP